MPRQANGSIRARANGGYEVRVTDPANGKRVSRYARTKSEAERLRRDMLARVGDGAPVVDSRTTVERFATEWLDTRAGRNRAASTVGEYRSRLRRHVFPVIGRKRLGDVSVTDVERVLDVAASNGASRATLRGVRNALGAVFSDAVRSRVLRVNPTQGAQLPDNTAPGVGRGIPSTEDVRRLLHETRGTAVGRVALVLAHTGARIGELLAAEWPDVGEDTWTIRRTLTRDDHGRTLVGVATKTRDTRTVALTPAAASAFREQRSTVAAARISSAYWDDSYALCFPTSIGTPRDTRNLRRELGKAAPWWGFGWHGLRHWHASVALLDSGLGLAAVAKVLGHRNTRTTSDVYGHLVAEGSARVADAVRDALA